MIGRGHEQPVYRNDSIIAATSRISAKPHQEKSRLRRKLDDRYILSILSMSSRPQSPVTLALKILSAQYRQSTGEAVTDADVDEIRSWAGDSAKKMSAWDAACVVIRRELARDGTARVQ